MKNILYLMFVAVLTVAASPVWGQNFGGGTGTSTDPYLITSEADWSTLGSVVLGDASGGKYFKLTADIYVHQGVGTESHPFRGTFDGNGYTITYIGYAISDNVIKPATYECVAPFCYIDGATIRGVKIVGTVYSENSFAGGIVGSAKGTCTVTNCINSTTIIHEYSISLGDVSNGGIVGQVYANGSINITDCLFDGTMSEGTTSYHAKWSGILGLCNSNCTVNISNCLVNPVNAVEYGNTLYRSNGTTNWSNCYYTKTIGNAQGVNGSSMTAEQLATALGDGWHVVDGKAVPYVAPFTLGDIPDGWTVTANGVAVTVTNGTAEIHRGDEVRLFPPQEETNHVKRTTLTDAPAPATSCRLIDLSNLKTYFVAQDCDTLTGTLDVAHYPMKISIADGATVTLAGVTINGDNRSLFTWAGITCEGDATIILKDGTTNTVKGFEKDYPGIQAGPPGKTLTIQGTGTLIASSNGKGEGIGGESCGNITITGGNITATGGQFSAGIGGDLCGKITITGGSVIAHGGDRAAGIGCSRDGSCADIEIGGTANVTATGGDKAAGIGSAHGNNAHSSCGDITIGGTATVTAKGGQYGAGIGSGKGIEGINWMSKCGNITIANTVTQVTATRGVDAIKSIGMGDGTYSTCGTVTIGGSSHAGVTPNQPDGKTYMYPNPLTTPLTTEALTAGTIIVRNPQSGMQYSKNGGTKQTLSGSEVVIEVDAHDKVAFYGNGTSITSYGSGPSSSITTFTGGTADVKVYGNIMSLVNEYNFATAFTLTENYTFFRLFYNYNNTRLTDASGLLLPATTLTQHCYEMMFYNCTALTAGPSLPAPTLTESCYSHMFHGCTSLTSVTCMATNISATDCISYWLFDVAPTGTLYVDKTMKEAIWNIPSTWTVKAKP